MEASKNFTDLVVWQYAHELGLGIYKATKLFPKDELFSLTNQLRRCAVSVPSNIAEGFNRFSAKEKTQFYSISLGSLGEIQSQLLFAKDLGYMTEESYTGLAGQAETTKKLLSSLIRSIKRS